MKRPKNTDAFIAYCRDYSWNGAREAPLNPRTVERYIRGLNLVKKIVGHDLESVSDTDQLVFIDGIMNYKQGTRRVSTQIFQRYIAWGIKHEIFTCENLIRGKEDSIIGEPTPPSYVYASRKEVGRFFQKLKTPQLRVVFGLIYYGGLTAAEVSELTVDNVTDDGIFVYRAVRKQSQTIPLPDHMRRQLIEWSKTRESRLFDLNDSLASRYKINEWFRAAQVETQELLGMTVRDFRRSGIRHFFELSQDLPLTKEFAGVPDNKRGWLDDLVDVSSYYMKKVNRARSFYGKPEMESGEEL